MYLDAGVSGVYRTDEPYETSDTRRKALFVRKCEIKKLISLAGVARTRGDFTRRRLIAHSVQWALQPSNSKAEPRRQNEDF